MITIEVNTDAISAALENFARSLEDMTPLMNDIGEGLVDSTKQRFGQGIAPDGSAWAKNSPVTLAMKRGSRPLFGESGALSSQFSYEGGKNFVVWGSPMLYARIQQFGAKKSEYPHLWGDIPARPFLGISDQDEADILDTVSEALAHLFSA